MKSVQKTFIETNLPNFSYDEEIVEFLLRNGANVNISNVNGSRPLHAAAENGKLLHLCSWCDMRGFFEILTERKLDVKWLS